MVDVDLYLLDIKEYKNNVVTCVTLARDLQITSVGYRKWQRQNIGTQMSHLSQKTLGKEILLQMWIENIPGAFTKHLCEMFISRVILFLEPLHL